ncbi:MAG: hypothetical protein CMP63_04490, partial [Flavobacteriales bacterium]|nr:hypothetical protein [Flavobacteriales bacterium]
MRLLLLSTIVFSFCISNAQNTALNDDIFWGETETFVLNDNFIVRESSSFVEISTDQGQTFSQLGTNSFNGIREIYFYDESFGFVSDRDSIFMTIDSGLTWVSVAETKNYEGIRMGKVHCYDANSCLYIGSNDTVYKTTDKGLTWNPVSHPNLSQYDFSFTYGNMTPLKINRNGKGILVGEKENVFETHLFTTSDYGNTWEYKKFLDNQNLLVLMDDNTIISSGTHGNQLKRSTDNGNSWATQTVDYEVFCLKENGRYVAALCTTSANYVVLCSSDYGETWIANEFSEPLYFADNIFVTPENIVYSFGS